MNVSELLNDKINSKRREIESLSSEIIGLQKQQEQQKPGIEEWVDYEFETSLGLTEEFNSFYHDIRKFLKKELKEEFELTVKRGHFEFLGFVKNRKTNKWAYFSCSDVRFFKNEWFKNLLVRTAKGERDFTGGRNTFSEFLNIRENLLKLTN